MIASIDTSLIDWSRAQFALTAMYHWLFVPLTLGLGVIQAIMETIQKLKGHLTIIIIVHRLSTVERCDRLSWVEEGQLHKVGTPAELLPEYTASLISKELTEQQGNRLGTTCCPSGTICISN